MDMAVSGFVSPSAKGLPASSQPAPCVEPAADIARALAQARKETAEAAEEVRRLQREAGPSRGQEAGRGAEGQEYRAEERSGAK